MSYFVEIVTKIHANKSLKDVLSSFFLSSDKQKYLLNNHCCFINGVVSNGNTILNEKDVICIDTSFYDNNNFLPDEYDLKILYEDDYLLIVDKPAKCIIYPDDKIKHHTMANYVLNYYLQRDISAKVRHIHRLDYDTTGCLVYAKDMITQAALSKMIEDGNFMRKYLAIVEGVFTHKKGKIKASISRDRHINGKMIVNKDGKQALTNYEVLGVNHNCSLLLLKLETGRTHQIRVHMSHIGHPLIGDKMYGSKIFSSRVFLHSHIVDFIHPITNQRIYIEYPMPQDMNEYWKIKKVD